MRKFIPYFLLLALAFTVQGCESEAVSRSFHANMDRTWEAALKVSQKMTGKAPAIANREKGKILTVWVNGETENLGDGVTGKHMEIWRGIISMKESGGWTKVSIRLEKGHVESTERESEPDRQEENFGVELWPERDKLQRKFLDEMEAQLGSERRRR